MSGQEQLPVPVAPARGAKAGVRSDVTRNKDGSYNPVGTGSAWSHNFLNQKPWHPLNFRNQVRKYEAEQKAVDDFKAREAAMAEWQAEQERTTTLAFLSPAEAKKQRDRASISFMYQKPPGLEAALARDRELDDRKQREAAAAAAAAAAGDSQPQLQAPAAAAAGGKPPLPSSSQQQQQQQQQQQEAQQEALRQRQQQLERLREDPFAAILAARSSLAASEKFVLKAVEGAFGGSVPGSENQLLLADEEEEEQHAAGRQQPAGAAEIDEAEALLASLDPRERAAVLAALEKKRRRADKAARLQQAQDLLRSAGIDPEGLQAAAAAADAGRDRGRSSSGRKRRHKDASRDDVPQQPSHKKHKTKNKKNKKSSKHKKHRKGRRSSGSDSGTSSSSGSSTDAGRSD